MADKYAQATNDAGDVVKKVGNAISDLTDTAKDKAGRAIDDAQHRAMDSFGDLENAIRRNPTQAALIAGGVGLLIGLILSR